MAKCSIYLSKCKCYAKYKCNCFIRNVPVHYVASQLCYMANPKLKSIVCCGNFLKCIKLCQTTCMHKQAKKCNAMGQSVIDDVRNNLNHLKVLIPIGAETGLFKQGGNESQKCAVK